MGHGRSPREKMPPPETGLLAEDTDRRRLEAVQILQAASKLFEDDELQEQLASLDERCGSILAAWNPPWLEEGIEGMDFPDDVLKHVPTVRILEWARSLAEVLQHLRAQAVRNELISEESFGSCRGTSSPSILVVVPQSISELQLSVIGTLVTLGGGQVSKALDRGSNGCQVETLPFASRMMYLDALDEAAWCAASKTADLHTEQEAQACGHFGDSSLRRHALWAVLGATPAAAIFAAEKEEQPQPSQPDYGVHQVVVSPSEERAVIQEPLQSDQSDRGETVASRATQSFDPPPRVSLPGPEPASCQNSAFCDAGVTVGGSSSSSSRPPQSSTSKPPRAGVVPSKIRFFHLDSLKAAEKQSEAVGLILGVMQLLRQDAVRAKLAVLDAFCDGLLSSWRPPWDEQDDEEILESSGEMTLERLVKEDEDKVHGWANELDGFLSFVADLAVAARTQQPTPPVEVPADAVDRCERKVCEVEEAEKAGLRGASDSDRPIGGEQTSVEPLAAPQGPAQKAEAEALVVVVPNNLADWHLEVLGPLLVSLDMFMLTEKAWKDDFGTAETVPFSVEALSSASASSSSTSKPL